MATAQVTRESSPAADERWYSLGATEVMAKLRVDLSSGLSDDEATQRLRHDGPNELPVEQPPSRLRRFLAEYESHMRVILVGAAIVSLVIKQWTVAGDIVARTTRLTAQQGGLALSAAVLLLLGWETGKWLARRRARQNSVTVPAP